MIYAGDRDTYAPDEKRQIVLNLRREWDHNPAASRSIGRVAGFGTIVSPEVADTLREILSADERGHAHQCYVLLLMQMLADGDPLPPLADLLEAIMRRRPATAPGRPAGGNHARRHVVSKRPMRGALAVLTGYAAQDSLDSAALRTLLHDIHGGSIKDRTNCWGFC